MSRPSAAVRLLLVSLPLAFSLPQAIPPYQLLNATQLLSSPTGVPEPAEILDPGIGDGTVPDDGLPIPIEPGIGDDTGPEIFVDPLLPIDPVPDPLPTVTVPTGSVLSHPFPEEPIPYAPTFLDIPPAAPTVSIKTFLSVVQPLLDIIGDLFSLLPAQDAPAAPLFSDAWPLRPLKGGSLRARQVINPGGPLIHAKPAANPAPEALTSAVGTPSTKPVVNELAGENLPALPLLGQLIQLINNVIALDASRGSHGGTLGKRDALSEASSDALAKFYASLASNQESIENIRPFAATLRKSIEALDDATKATVLSVLGSRPTRLELVKRDAGTRFIKRYTREFHYFYPVLQDLRPDVAEGLQAVLDDPTVPVPKVETLNLEDLPNRLRLFVLDMYTFFDMLADSSIPIEDRLSLLTDLSDDLNVEKRNVIKKRSTVEPEIQVDSPTWDDDRLRRVIEVLAHLDPAGYNLYFTSSPAEYYEFWDGFYNPDVPQDFDTSKLGVDSPDQRKIVWQWYQLEKFLDSLPEAEKDEVYDMINEMEDQREYVYDRRGLRARKVDDELDHASGESITKRYDYSYDDYMAYYNSIRNLVLDGPPFDADRIKQMMKILGLGDAAEESLDSDSDDQYWDAFYYLNTPDHGVDFKDFPDNSKDMRKYVPAYAQWDAFMTSLPEADQYEFWSEIETIINEAQVGEQRRKLRARQSDEGTTLDDAPKLGSELDYVLGPGGSLDPMGQTWQGVDNQPNGGEDYQQESADDSYPGSYGDDYSSQSADDGSYGSDYSSQNAEDPYVYNSESPSTGSGDDSSTQSYDTYPSGPSNDNWEPASYGEDEGPSSESFDSDPTAQGDGSTAGTPAQDGSYDDYTPSNADLKPAFSDDVGAYLETGTSSEPEQVPDLGEWNDYGPQFIDDFVQGDLGGNWNTDD